MLILVSAHVYNDTVATPTTYVPRMECSFEDTFL